MLGHGGRELGFIAAALAVHAALLLAPAKRPPPIAPSSALADAIELTVDDPPAPAPAAAPPRPLDPPPAETSEPPRAAPAPPGAAAAAAPRAAAVREVPSPPEAPPAREPAAAEVPPAPPAAPPAPPIAPPAAPALEAHAPVAPPSPPSPPAGEYGPTPPGPPANGLPPGLGGTPVWAAPGVIPGAPAPTAAPTVAPAPRAPDKNVAGKVLDASLRKRDHELGLDVPAAGVVAGTLADAVRQSAIPGDARATFDVRVNGDGAVENVKLVSSTAGDARTWNKVIGAAQRTLAARSLAMGEGKTAVTLRVKVESNVQFPAGNKTKIDVQPVCANEIIDQIEAALKDPNSIGAGGPPGGAGTGGARLGVGGTGLDSMTEEQRRKFCIPVGIRGKGDASNIGAHATNVVKSSVTVMRDGEHKLPSGNVLAVDTRVPWALPDPTKVRAPPPPKKKKPWKPGQGR